MRKSQFSLSISVWKRGQEHLLFCTIHKHDDWRTWNLLRVSHRSMIDKTRIIFFFLLLLLSRLSTILSLAKLLKSLLKFDSDWWLNFYFTVFLRMLSSIYWQRKINSENDWTIDCKCSAIFATNFNLSSGSLLKSSPLRKPVG